MSKQSTCAIFAVISGLPALLILANLTMYASVGCGFFPEGKDYMNAARFFITFLSTSVSLFLLNEAVK